MGWSFACFIKGLNAVTITDGTNTLTQPFDQTATLIEEVPEPMSVAILGADLTSMALRRRRRSCTA